MTQVTVKNLAKGNQFVHTSSGTRELPAGQDGTADFSDGEIASMLKNPSLELSVDGQVVSNQVSEKAKPLAERGPVWGEGMNEAGSPLRPGQTMAAKPLSKKAQKAADDLAKALDEKRAEATEVGAEFEEGDDLEALQAKIDAKLAE